MAGGDGADATAAGPADVGAGVGDQGGAAVCGGLQDRQGGEVPFRGFGQVLSGFLQTVTVPRN